MTFIYNADGVEGVTFFMAKVLLKSGDRLQYLGSRWDAKEEERVGHDFLPPARWSPHDVASFCAIERAYLTKNAGAPWGLGILVPTDAFESADEPTRERVLNEHRHSALLFPQYFTGDL